MEDNRLYEAFGELLYVVAMADGVIDKSETDKLNELLAGNKWAKAIKWSFDYEVDKARDPEMVYDKVISYCHRHGPAPEYLEFISAMEQIADASGKVHPNEKDVIKSFSHDLTERFRADLEKLNSDRD